jgi:hypothetical protein
LNHPNNIGGNQTPRSPIRDAMPHIILRGVGILVIAILALFVASTVIGALGEQAEKFFRYISRLFRDAPYMFRHARGFGAFIQLILVAGFVGWAINRFKGK